ncbi:acetyl-CoA carboxylase, biotin carboxyl carrier protein [candidate division LCP-89 bacterium B3_LCP]|uniref:Biotin carboxyl carrier protein of acetyl-CoA carboxylase n=1 Tax=candidate division LCP-89 bacterium B3_LCP TaxID=2012998 RepID=A0A532V3K8_UNCL8|nr:MAG: acetyl-CoA carboxylase, biotin carboxyl carrier protein [candidate division LCP-89 bacterium B3_LCP]
MFDLKDVRRLVKLLENSQISEIEISDGDRKIRLAKPATADGQQGLGAVVPVMQPVVSQSPPTASISEELEKPQLAAGLNVRVMKAPMVGTFYTSSSPDAEPYVQVGDVVHKGQVLCIVEAMKLMNEIESEYSGRIMEIMAENAQAVEFDQELFIIEAA